MNSTEALARLKSLRVPVVRTSEAAAVLGATVPSTSRMLARLAGYGLVARVRQGMWWIGETIDPLVLPEFLTAPYPSYVSLQSALYLHGLISQIPAVTYAVSLAPTEEIETAAGMVSIHRIAPGLFGGFTTLDSGARMATPEKALFDVAYLSGTRSRLFARLPEVELPRTFKTASLVEWVERIKSPRTRSLVLNALRQIPSVARRLRALPR